MSTMAEKAQGKARISEQVLRDAVTYEEEALETIKQITIEIERIYQEFESKRDRSEYKRYEEFFLQKNIELDNVDARNIASVRDYRKSAVRYVQDCLRVLDEKTRRAACCLSDPHARSTSFDN